MDGERKKTKFQMGQIPYRNRYYHIDVSVFPKRRKKTAAGRRSHGFVKAVVVQNDHEVQQAQASLDSGDTQEIVLKIKSGSHKGETVDAYSLNGYLYGADCKVGTKVIASLSEYDGELSANVYNYDRELEIGLLLASIFWSDVGWLEGKKDSIRSLH